MRGEKQGGKGKELAREAGSILATQPRPGPQRGGLCGTERGPSLSSSRTEDPRTAGQGGGPTISAEQHWRGNGVG